MPSCRLLLLGILLFLPWITKGQSLTFCLDHTPEGKGIGMADTFHLAQAGEAIELLFRSASPLISPKLYFFIDYWDGSRYVEFDTKTHIPEHGSKWAALQYRFTQSGAYRVLVLNADKEELCRGHVMINVAEDENSPAYFEGVNVLVCSAAPKGQPLDTLESYQVRPGQSPVLSVLIRHKRPLAMSRMLADVWVGTGEGSGLYVETIEFEVEPAWTYTQFKYEFSSYGVYTFRIYNEQEVYMGSAQVSVETR